MRAYYFPGALPNLSEVIIFVNQPCKKSSKTTTTTTTTLNLVTTQDLKSSKLHIQPTRATKSEMAKSATVPAQVSDFDMESYIFDKGSYIFRDVIR